MFEEGLCDVNVDLSRVVPVEFRAQVSAAYVTTLFCSAGHTSGNRSQNFPDRSLVRSFAAVCI